VCSSCYACVNCDHSSCSDRKIIHFLKEGMVWSFIPFFLISLKNLVCFPTSSHKKAGYNLGYISVLPVIICMRNLMSQEPGLRFGALWSSSPELPLLPSASRKSAKKGRNPSNLCLPQTCQNTIEVELRMKQTQLIPRYSQNGLILAK